MGKFLQELFPEYKIATLDIDQLSKRNATSQLMNKSLNISMDLPNNNDTPPLFHLIPGFHYGNVASAFGKRIFSR